jgi:hypothetical protein
VIVKNLLSKCYIDKNGNFIKNIDTDSISGEVCGGTGFLYNHSNEL